MMLHSQGMSIGHVCAICMSLVGFDQSLEPIGEGTQAKVVKEATEVEEENPDLDASALRVVRIMGTRAVPALVAIVSNEGGMRRLDAVRVLGAIGPDAREAVPALIKALGDPDAEVREACAATLGAIGPAAVNPLVAVLKDRNALGHHSYAALALGRIGPAAQEAIPSLLLVGGQLEELDAHDEFVAALRLIGPPAVPRLVAAIQDESSQSRFLAICALSRMGPAVKPVVPELEKLLKQGAPAARAAAALALGGIGPAAKEAGPALAAAARSDPDPEVAWTAKAALDMLREQQTGDTTRSRIIREGLAVHLGTTRKERRKGLYDGLTHSRQLLATLAHNPDAQARARAVEDLGGYSRWTVLAGPFAGALKDPDPAVRAAAARKLSQIIGPDPTERPALLGLVPATLALLDDPSPIVREAATRALATLNPPDPKVTASLAEVLKREDHTKVRAALAESLGQRQLSPEQFGALDQALRDEAEDVRVGAVKGLGVGLAWGREDANISLPALVRMLGDRSEEVRMQAVESLMIGGRRAIPSLIEAMKNAEGESRLFTILALGEAIKVEQAIDEVGAEDVKEDDRQRDRAIVKALAIRALAPAIAALKDPNEDVREAAIDLLRRIGAPALPALIELLANSDERARDAAVLALTDVVFEEEGAEKTLISSLGSPRNEVRQGAIKVLSDVARELVRVRTSLKSAVSDPDPRVREGAQLILNSIAQ
jgi:HEAT repeat protein